MIKVVIQAIPCYTMNCFRILKGLIHDIHQIMARFWWNNEGNERKIHWISWKRMCWPKCRGGMGFRDLELFNKSLLAKQCWKIINDPSHSCQLCSGVSISPTITFLRQRWGTTPHTSDDLCYGGGTYFRKGFGGGWVIDPPYESLRIIGSPVTATLRWRALARPSK